jgi:hypothetical protein
MLTGYNTDFKFQGKVYHVQTEDGGANSPSITSLLYHQGAILSSRKTSYADILKADCLDEVVRELMIEQHKQLIRDLMHGKLDVHAVLREAPSQPPLSPKASSAAKVVPAVPIKETEPPKPAPAPQKSVPMAEEREKSLDDIILDFLAQEQQERSQKK